MLLALAEIEIECSGEDSIMPLIHNEQRRADVDSLPEADGAASSSQPKPAGQQCESQAVSAVGGGDATGRFGSGRWWVAVVVGTIASLPFAWILSYAAALPYFIGLFFFALFGLVIGAVAHRVAAPARPFRSSILVVGTTCIVLTTWTLSMVKEAKDFPKDMVKQAEATHDIGDRTIAQFRAEVASNVRGFLRERYPPGGTMGYVRWVLTNGQIQRGELAAVDRTLGVGQSGFWWALRVVLSAALLAFGVGSQTLALRLARDPIVRAMDDKTPEA